MRRVFSGNARVIYKRRPHLFTYRDVIRIYDDVIVRDKRDKELRLNDFLVLATLFAQSEFVRTGFRPATTAVRDNLELIWEVFRVFMPYTGEIRKIHDIIMSVRATGKLFSTFWGELTAPSTNM